MISERLFKLLSFIAIAIAAVSGNLYGHTGRFDATGQYFMSSFNDSWDASNEFCTNIGFGLLSVETEEENIYILDVFDIFPYERVWIGATDVDSEGMFYWSHTSEPLNFTSWHDGEPSGTDPNTGIEENCVLYWNHDGITKWNDVPCERSFKFICEKI